MTLKEIQKIINEYYRKGGDYSSAAQKYAEEKHPTDTAAGIKAWNNLVNERNRQAKSLPVAKKEIVAAAKKLTSQKVDLYYPRSQTPKQPQVKNSPAPKPMVAAKQQPVAKQKKQTSNVAPAQKKITASSKKAAPAPKPIASKTPQNGTKVANKQKKKSSSILSKATRLLNNLSEDFFAGMDVIGAGKVEDVLVRNREKAMQKKAQTPPKWDDRRYNEFMTGDSSSINKKYRDHIKSRANMDSKIAYVDKGSGRHGDEKVVIWDDDAQKVRVFNTSGTSAPAAYDPSAKNLDYLKYNWLKEQGKMSGGISGTYRGISAPYSWANPSATQNVTVGQKKSAQDYLDKLYALGIKNPETGIQYWNEGSGNDPLQVSWGNMVPQGEFLPNQLHASSCEGGTPGCTRFGPNEWDEVLRLMMSKNNRYISTYDNMFTRR